MGCSNKSEWNTYHKLNCNTKWEWNTFHKLNVYNMLTKQPAKRLCYYKIGQPINFEEFQ